MTTFAQLEADAIAEHATKEIATATVGDVLALVFEYEVRNTGAIGGILGSDPDYPDAAELAAMEAQLTQEIAARLAVEASMYETMLATFGDPLPPSMYEYAPPDAFAPEPYNAWAHLGRVELLGVSATVAGDGRVRVILTLEVVRNSPAVLLVVLAIALSILVAGWAVNSVVNDPGYRVDYKGAVRLTPAGNLALGASRFGFAAILAAAAYLVSRLR